MARTYAKEVNVADTGAYHTIMQMNAWVRNHDLILNRLLIINQLHGCRYDRCSTNPCGLRHRGGTYDVEMYGVVVASYGLYDVSGVEDALALVDMLARLSWNGNAAGWAKYSPTPCEGWRMRRA